MKMTETKVDAPDDQDSDHEEICDQVAREMMDAFESKDKDKLFEAFHYLVADIMSKLSSDGQE